MIKRIDANGFVITEAEYQQSLAKKHRSYLTRRYNALVNGNRMDRETHEWMATQYLKTGANPRHLPLWVRRTFSPV